ncbi:Intradiol ring-cleavage dioxygenase-like protein [Calycina marina]|uniref:Intradiol ring-cleavage dioxygenase-like protein n=1 Tax=Calycina marina TaxID=1763456 RepID=A0A9P8CKP3_9HELO|nr:Intradiol ring-cleavage dioxygenase-like protein [Calycina marina]
MQIISIAVAALCATSILARPGHNIEQEIAERAAYPKTALQWDISHCSEKLKARGIMEQNIKRLKNHTSHVVYTPESDQSVVIAGNSSCVLQLEVTEGPYYVAGEYAHENIIERQPGIDLMLDIQVLDTTICDSVPEIYSNDLGVATFTTAFPGHYAGHAPHIHTAANFNGTYAGGYVSHVRQIYSDQSLINVINTMPVYTTNSQNTMLNQNDGTFAGEAAARDLVPECSILPDDVEDGIFGWVAFGIDLTYQYIIHAVATLTVGSSVANPGGGGGPEGGPPGGFPSSTDPRTTGHRPIGSFSVRTGPFPTSSDAVTAAGDTAVSWPTPHDVDAEREIA